MNGRKDDHGKPQWSLLMGGCPDALAGVVDVLTFGAGKYAPHNWQIVPEGQIRYRDALYRHLSEIERQGDDSVDPETGLMHWSHVVCNALFLAQMAGRFSRASSDQEKAV